MRRFRTAVIAVATAAATVTLLPADAEASAGTPVPAPPFDYVAGDVCAFPVHAEFPVDEQRALTRTTAGGTTYQVVTGRLVGVVTNTATGRSVRRDLSGVGLSRATPDGAFQLAVQGAALIGFHGGDRPAHQLEVNGANSSVVVSFTATGQRTRVVQHGPYEDLCRTLSR